MLNLPLLDDALDAIAEKAIERKTGARGLRSILEELLLDTMFEVPDEKGLDKVVVERDTVTEKKKPVFIFSDKKDKPKKDKKDKKSKKEASK